MSSVYILPKEKSATVSPLALGICASYTPVSFNILRTDTVLLNWRTACSAFCYKETEVQPANLQYNFKRVFAG